MSRPQPYVLWSKSDCWFLYDPSSRTEVLVGPRDSSSAEIVERLNELTGERKRKTSFIVLLDARDVLFSSFLAEEVNGSRNRQTLLYQLESNLPLSAEEILADFCFSGGRRTGLVSAITCSVHSLRPLLKSMREAGCEVVCVSATSSVVVQRLLSERGLPSKFVVVLENGLGEPRFELVWIDKGGIADWRIANDEESLRHNIRMLNSNDILPIYAVSANNCSAPGEEQGGKVDPRWIQVLRQNSREAELVSITGDRQAYETSAIVDLVSRRLRPWFDLVRDPRSTAGENDPLSRKRNWSLAAIVAFSLLIAAAACGWRIQRVENAMNDLQMRQRDVFRNTFANQRPPAAVLTRLRSEYSKLAGSRESSGNPVPQPVEAIPVLRKLLTALPERLSFEVNEVRINDGELYLDVDLRQHRDAAVLAEGLQAEGFLLSPPTTESFDDGVRALLRGRLGSDPS